MTGVHPLAFIGPDVEIGSNVTIGPFTAVTGPCRIGDDVWIGPHASIGTPAEIRGAAHPSLDAGGGAGVVIGDRTVLREFVTVNQGSEQATVVGADCYVMDGAHIPHDAELGDRVTVACNVLIAGHCWIGEGANLGLGSVFHQFSVVGAFAMIGMQATITKPVPPFAIAYGIPARVAGANRVGLARLGVATDVIERWDAELRSGRTAGHDGPEELADHVRAFESRVPPAGG